MKQPSELIIQLLIRLLAPFFYRHFGSNRINGKISENVTAIKPVCEADADFLHLPAPRSKEENDFWLNLAGPQFKDYRNLWLAITDAETEGTWLMRSVMSYHGRI